MLDLSKTERELWEGLDRKARWGINKAKQRGLIVRGAFDREEKEYYNIYKNMCKEKKIKKNKKEDFDTMRIKVCVINENIVIGGVSLRLTREKGICGLHTNASIPFYRNLCVNELLYWEAIKFAKEQGYSKFDLGGYVPDAKEGDAIYGVNKFKEKWGGELTYRDVYTKNPLKLLRRIFR